MKKNFTKILSLLMALTLCLSFPVGVSAAELPALADNVLIDETSTGSMTIFKYDLTSAEKDGVWDSSYVSTGVYDQTGVNDILGGSNESDLGNGAVAYGYAIPGVEFSYVKIADIVQYSAPDTDDAPDANVKVLYGIDTTAAADFLKVLNLEDGANRVVTADILDETKYFYESDVLIDALASALETNPNSVKNALETFIAGSGTAMPLTNAYGKTGVENLELGLYLVVETAVPEMVVSTTNPFLVSVPMTTVNGTNADNGGTQWIYDITLYPKNLTGIPSLEKTLREQASDTGKNDGSSNILDGFAHTGTASAGDVIDYQIISTLPSITSESTYLSCYTFIDTLSPGITYNKGDVVLEIFYDTNFTDSIKTWTEDMDFFAVHYNTTESGEAVMTIEMTEAGLKEINQSDLVYAENMVNSGFSDCTIRISYQATVDSDNSLVCGDEGNPNNVVLTWKRSSEDFYDTLVDDCHLYTYAIDLTKLFSDGNGDFRKVQFVIQNDSDSYFVKAELNEAEGIYYVVDHVTDTDEATRFVPVDSGNDSGKIIVKGLEDDSYVITEIRTDNGYTLLKDDIEVVISQEETTDYCSIYSTDVLGLIQNDPRYASIITDAASLKNIPQKQLAHRLLTASAMVDNNRVSMLEDNGSVNAMVPMTVVNTRGFDLPETGDHGTMAFTVMGILIMAGAAGMLYIAMRKKNNVR